MATPILATVRYWTCPACNVRDVTNNPRPHTQFHACAGAGGMTVPMVPEGTKAKITRQEREDYVGNELVQTDADGRPVMAIAVERNDDVTDVVVFAPTARAMSQANPQE